MDDENKNSPENEIGTEFDKIKEEQLKAKEAAEVRSARIKDEDYGSIHEEYTPDIHDLPDKKTPKISVKKIIKYMGIGLVIFVYALIMVRIFLQNNVGVKMITQKLCNIETLKAYNECRQNGEEFDVISQDMTSYYITLETDDAGRPTKTEKVVRSEYSSSKDFGGMFYASDFLYYEDSHQVVVTLRFNRASLNTLKDVYNLSEIKGEPFFFTLDDGKSFYDDYEYITEKRSAYYYRRLIFNNVTIDNAQTISINIYYKNDIQSYESPIDYITVYDKEIPTEKCKIESSDFDKITEGITKAPTVNKGK